MVVGDTVYVADPGAGNVIWSLPTTGGTPTAFASDARFQGLRSITYFNNALYVADGGNSTTGTIWKVDLGTSPFNEFPIGHPASPALITTGPDGNLWFTEYQEQSRIGRITPEGKIQDFFLPRASWPGGITVGPDGNLWFTEPVANRIGKMRPDGVLLAEYTVPTPSSTPFGITVGPDGNLWFTEGQGNKLGRISIYGVFSGEYTVPTASSYPQGITVGPDGNLWFTENSGNKIGRLTTNGEFTEFQVPTANSGAYWITVGPDDNLWFTEATGNKIGQITPTGQISEFGIPTAGSLPQVIVTGSDGNLWFTEYLGNKLGRIGPDGMIIAEYLVPTPNCHPGGITVGPDGYIWFTESNAGQIGQYIGGTRGNGPSAPSSGHNLPAIVTLANDRTHPVLGWTTNGVAAGGFGQDQLPNAWLERPFRTGSESSCSDITSAFAGAHKGRVSGQTFDLLQDVHEHPSPAVVDVLAINLLS